MRIAHPAVDHRSVAASIFLILAFILPVYVNVMCDSTVIYGQAISARSCLAVLLSRLCLDCDYCVYMLSECINKINKYKQCRLGRDLPPCQVASCSIQSFGHKRYGPKIGGLCPFGGGRAGSPSNTMWTRPTHNPHAKFCLDPSNRLATIQQRHRQTGQWTTVR